jgi:hypothetical protein
MSGNWYDAIVSFASGQELKGITIKLTEKSNDVTTVEYNKHGERKAFVYYLSFRIKENGNLSVSYHHPHNSLVSDDDNLFKILRDNVNADMLKYTTYSPESKFPLFNDTANFDVGKLIEKGLLSLLFFYDITRTTPKDVGFQSDTFKYEILQYDASNVFKGFEFTGPVSLNSIQGNDGDILVQGIIQTHSNWVINYSKFIKIKW